MSESDRLPLPPHNLDAERCALGSMLLDNAAILDVADVLRPDDFYRDNHQLICRAIFALHEAGGPVDAIMLDEELRRRGEFEKAGGFEAIREILEAPPHAANARYYADIVHQKAIARAVLKAAMDTHGDVYSKSFDAYELLERAEGRIFAIGQGRSRKQPRSIAEISGEAMDRILARKANQLPGGLMTGFTDLDFLIGGFRPGQMIILAARPSMGKTALAFAIASHFADRRGIGTLFMSVEMSEAELGERYLSLRSGVPMRKAQQPCFAGEGELNSLREAVAPHGTPFWIDDSASPTPTQVLATARRLKARHDLGLVTVDYLQLVSPENEKLTRQEQVATTSKKLKALAKDLSLPVLALAQLNRQSEQREGRRPMLSDLKESGQIEQDADIVLLLHRPEYYDANDRPGIAELIIAKNRNGPTDTINLMFEKEQMRFSNLEHRLEPAF